VCCAFERGTNAASCFLSRSTSSMIPRGMYVIFTYTFFSWNLFFFTHQVNNESEACSRNCFHADFLSAMHGARHTASVIRYQGARARGEGRRVRVGFLSRIWFLTLMISWSKSALFDEGTLAQKNTQTNKSTYIHVQTNSVHVIM